MIDAQSFSGNVEAAFVRLEGKIDLLVAKLDNQVAETMRVRGRVHEIANDVSPIVALDVPARFASFEARIGALERDREQRKGAMSVMRALWALIGFIGAGSIVAIVKLLGAA